MKVVIVKCESSEQIKLFRIPENRFLRAGDLIFAETNNKGT